MSEVLSPLGLGLAGKSLLSELPYKLVPSTIIDVHHFTDSCRNWHIL